MTVVRFMLAFSNISGEIEIAPADMVCVRRGVFIGSIASSDELVRRMWSWEMGSVILD